MVLAWLLHFPKFIGLYNSMELSLDVCHF